MGWEIRVKHAASPALPEDGVRVLVDRRWPPGLTRREVLADLWLRDLAPSDELLRRRHGRPGAWSFFAAEYRAELAANGDLGILRELHERGPLTLLHGIRDAKRNNAAVLRDVLQARLSSGDES